MRRKNLWQNKSVNRSDIADLTPEHQRFVPHSLVKGIKAKMTKLIWFGVTVCWSPARFGPFVFWFRYQLAGASGRLSCTVIAWMVDCTFSTSSVIPLGLPKMRPPFGTPQNETSLWDSPVNPIGTPQNGIPKLLANLLQVNPLRTRIWSIFKLPQRVLTFFS